MWVRLARAGPGLRPCPRSVQELSYRIAYFVGHRSMQCRSPEPTAPSEPGPLAAHLDPAGGVDDLGVAQLAQGLPLDQPDALAGQAHDLAHVAQAHGVAVAQAVAERDDPALP